MLEPGVIQKGIEKKEKQWKRMKLVQKRKMILNYWKDVALVTKGEAEEREVLKQILITKELMMPELEIYLDKVHQSILDHAKKLEQEGQ